MAGTGERPQATSKDSESLTPCRSGDAGPLTVVAMMESDSDDVCVLRAANEPQPQATNESHPDGSNGEIRAGDVSVKAPPTHNESRGWKMGRDTSKVTFHTTEEVVEEVEETGDHHPHPTIRAPAALSPDAPKNEGSPSKGLKEARKVGEPHASLATVLRMRRSDSTVADVNVDMLTEWSKKLDDMPRQPKPRRIGVVAVGGYQSPRSQSLQLTGKSLCLFPPDSPFRCACHSLIHNTVAECVILCVVFVNIVVMAFEGPPRSSSSGYHIVDLIFAAIYLVEMVLRVVALGFVAGPETYLRDPWNRLDFIVVLSAWINIIPTVSFTLSPLRAFRAIRAVRLMRFFTGMRAILEALHRSMQLIADVLAFLLFFIVVYALVGNTNFAGSLQRRCYVEGTDLISFPEVFCSDKTYKGLQCPSNQECRFGSNPNYGFSSFDDIGHSALLIQVSTSGEGWSRFMYSLMDSEYSVSAIYFVSLVFVVSLMVINLFVAVVVGTFSKVRRESSTGRSGFTDDDRSTDFDRIVESERARHSTGPPAEEPAPVNQTLEPSSPAGKVLQAWKHRCEQIVQSPSFDHVVCVLLVTYAILLGLRREGLSNRAATLIDILDMIFVAGFLVESIVRIVGNGGLTGYFNTSRYNRFDFIIVCFSVISVIVELSGVSKALLKALRALRITRLLRLSTSPAGLRKLLDTTFASTMAIFNVTVFMLLFLVCYTLMGVQVYGDNYGEPLPRTNFQNFRLSMMTFFQILTGDNWDSILYRTMDSPDGWSAPIIIITFFVISRYILLNLFVAVILENFELAEESKASQQEIEFHKKQLQEAKRELPLNVLLSVPDNEENRAKKIMLNILRVWSSSAKILVAPGQAGGQRPTHASSSTAPLAPVLEMVEMESNTEAQEGAADKAPPPSPPPPPLADDDDDDDDDEPCDDKGKQQKDEPPTDWLSLISKGHKDVACLLGPQNTLRHTCIRIVDSRWFQPIIMVVILFSCVLLAMENPKTREDDTFSDFTRIMDVIFYLVFFLELIIKVVAKGWILLPNSYFRDSWNLLDFVVIILMGIGIIFEGTSGTTTYGRIARATRSLRAFRLISLGTGMRRIARALFKSMPSICNVVLLNFLLMWIFSVIGVALFSGKLYSCNDTDVASQAECVGTFVNAHGLLVPRAWRNPPWNFDSIGHALKTLFVVSSLEGWANIMYSTMDITGRHEQPERDASSSNGWFFVVYVIIMNFFILNLFIGVIIEKYNIITGTALLTEKQEHWVEMRKMMVNLRLFRLIPRPTAVWRQCCYDLVVNCKSPEYCRNPKYHSIHANFERVIVFLIIVNGIFIATEHYDQPESWQDTLHVVNLIFVAIFTLEMLIKWTAMGIRNYFRQGWNVFDAIIVFGSIIVLFTQAGVGTQVARVFRIGRVLRLVRKARGLRMLFNTLLISLPAIINITAVFVIFFFMYAVLGIEFYGNVRFGGGLERRVNFRSFGTAMLTLLRMSQGEDWYRVYFDCSVESPRCSAGDCGSSWAWIFFFTFITIGSYMFVNIFIATVLKNFLYVISREEALISDRDLRKFKLLWLRFDPQSTGHISLFHLRELVENLGEPLAEKPMRKLWFRAVCRECRSQANKNGMVPFRVVLLTLGVFRMGLDSLTFSERLERERRLRRLLKAEAADRIIAAFRGWKARKMARRRWSSAIRSVLTGGRLRKSALQIRGTESPRAVAQYHASLPGEIDSPSGSDTPTGDGNSESVMK